ncbi:multiple sugar transport system substrate-binding protein [Crossiella equi]|uniref:Multiple sugar transport system substrate-binding protein n=1 Tax=Crossiella equi TaxID=130796 RepID=A0ABS5AIU8_9PSEU|nr:multiple sugar transport system substrate-binding protein [Crossiella equi]
MLSATVVAAPLLAACGSGESGGNIINLYGAPEQNFQKVVDTCNQQAGGKYQIVYNKLPRGADGQREQQVRRLAAQDSEMDIVYLDAPWLAEFAGAGWLMEWTGQNKAEVERGVLPGPLASTQYQGKTYAATKNTNVQLLWYRDDVVSKPPATWDEMIAQAKELKAAGKPHTTVLTGAQYEGLVVHYNTLVNSLGGKIISDDGTKAVIDEGAVKALQILKDFATSGIASTSLTNSYEDDVRLEFEKGNAAFQLNWPFVYPAMQKGNPELAKKFKWARFPGATPGVPSRVTIGGANWGVSKYTRKPELAFEATLCLRSPESQLFSVLNDGVPPTIDSVYDRPEMLKDYPFKDTIREELKDASVRPLTPSWQNVASVMSTILSPPSAIDPQQTAARLRTEVQDAIDSKGVMP